MNLFLLFPLVSYGLRLIESSKLKRANLLQVIRDISAKLENLYRNDHIHSPEEVAALHSGQELTDVFDQIGVTNPTKLNKVQGRSSSKHEAKSKPSEPNKRPPPSKIYAGSDDDLRRRAEDRTGERSVKARGPKDRLFKNITSKRAIEVLGVKGKGKRKRADEGDLVVKNLKLNSTRKKEKFFKRLMGKHSLQSVPISYDGVVPANQSETFNPVDNNLTPDEEPKDTISGDGLAMVEGTDFHPSDEIIEDMVDNPNIDAENKEDSESKKKKKVKEAVKQTKPKSKTATKSKPTSTTKSKRKKIDVRPLFVRMAAVKKRKKSATSATEKRGRRGKMRGLNLAGADR